MVYIIPFPCADTTTVHPFTYPLYHSESEYGIVNSIILNVFELWLNSFNFIYWSLSVTVPLYRSWMAPIKSIMTPRDNRLRCGLHHLVSTNRCRCSTSFHYAFISFRTRIWNSQFYNSEYVWNMIELLFSLCYPWISFNFSIKVWPELQNKST